MDVAKLLDDLDSTNNSQDEAKRKLAETFNYTKDAWLVHGLIEYYNHTMSSGVLDVLSKVSQPHDRFIFDRLSDLIREKDSKGSQNKLTALTIFGYIVRVGPSWLHKVTSHNLLKEILKLLRNERDIVVYMSALWAVLALLPIVPSSAAQYLQELFEVFSHLAAWKNSQTLNDEQHFHLQIGLYFLFHRLYGMYPCNFTDYIKQNYMTNKDKQSIFQHTIKGLLETVKIHPLLITATKDSEISAARWKKMEPHDVVFECARLSLEYKPQEDLVNECGARNVPPIRSVTSATKLQDLMLHNKNLLPISAEKFESLWSPSNVVLATPPPGALSSHTSTPTPNVHTYGMQSTSQPNEPSPPETAVEATPETTPMKENMKPVHSLPTTSTIARAIWNNSQPSSPLKKDPSPFRFQNVGHTFDSNTASSQRLIKMIEDRNTASQMRDEEDVGAEIKALASPITVNNEELSQEDQEVRKINSQPVTIKRAESTITTLDDTLTNTIDFEHQGSPCSVGGLHMPVSSSLYELKAKVNRLRLVSNCLEDASFSAGTSPEQGNISISRSSKFRIRRFNSWPRMNIVSSDVRLVGDPRYKIKKEAKEKQNSSEYYQKLRDDLSSKNTTLGTYTTVQDATVQTITIYQQPYDQLMTGIFNEEIKLRNASAVQERKSSIIKTPHELLDKLIEMASKRNRNNANCHMEDEYKESLKLLHLHLLYERHRREVHADRNRRLLGISRQMHHYEQNHDTLSEQVRILSNDLYKAYDQLSDFRRNFNTKEHDMLKESETWRNKYVQETEENQKLRAQVEMLQSQLNDAAKNKRENQIEMESARGELFDLKNELRQITIQAELGQQYKDELNRLQCEVIMMGEVQMKCREKFSNINLLEAKDSKIELLQESYLDEINLLKASLESKSSQLETARIRLSELENQLTRRDVISSDLKRDLKRTREEYQEKINALEKKYTAQKAIMLRKDEHILELYKTRSPVNLLALSPESERVSDMACSLEHASSPLSLSQTSSEGLSASLKSVTEIRNLQALVQQKSVHSSFGNSSGDNSNLDFLAKSSPANIDIPPPSTSRGPNC